MAAARDPFHTEAEMAPHLRPHIKALTGTPVKWFTEVPAVNGIPDVTLVRFNSNELRRRARHGLVMPDDMSIIRTAMALSDADADGLTVAQLSAATRLTAGLLRRKALPTLVDTGWAVRRGASWKMTRRYADPASTLVTVELKLRDWRKALHQALQASMGADFSWVVLDSTATAAASSVELFAHRAVGLAMLGRQTLDVVQEPRQGRTDPARRAVLAERLLAMRASGVEVGPERHVFGRILT